MHLGLVIESVPRSVGSVIFAADKVVETALPTGRGTDINQVSENPLNPRHRRSILLTSCGNPPDEIHDDVGITVVRCCHTRFADAEILG